MSKRHSILAGMAITAAAIGVQPAAAAEFVIGSIMDITGTNAAIGSRIAKGIELAVENMNQKKYLGDNTIKLIQEDNGTDKGQALTLINRFALRDKVLAIIGPSAGPVAIAIAPNANELKMPFLAATYSEVIYQSGPWTFKFPEDNDEHVRGLAKYVVDKMKPKRCYFAYMRDNEGYIIQSRTFRDAMKGAGVEIIGESTAIMTDTDFTAEATKIASLKPDCLHIAMSPATSGNLLLQARSAGMPAETKIFAGGSQASNDFMAAAGPVSEGIYVFSDYTPGGVNAEGKAFEESYMKRYNTEVPDNWATIGYALMTHLGWALKQSLPNPTPEKIRDALASAKDVPTIVGTTGTYSLDKNRAPHYGSTILLIKNKTLVPAPK